MLAWYPAVSSRTATGIGIMQSGKAAARRPFSLSPLSRRTIMVQSNSIASANEHLARQINLEARQDPKSPYAGKMVGFANGQIVVVADPWREVGERLRQVEPDPTKCYCLEASADYDRMEVIWRMV
jgi:hypothetical protein